MTAEVAGDRLLAGQQVHGAPLEVVAQRVDRVVGDDHALGEIQVGIQQRRGGAVDRRTDQPGHLDQLASELVQLLVVRVPHG